MAALFTTDFPIYSIDSFDNKLFYVTGGGGKAKTGVPNCLELYKLDYNSDGIVNAVLLCKHNMKDELIMQSEASNKDQLMIAASVNRDCHIYDIKYTENSDKVEEIGPKDVDDIAEKDSIVFDRDNVKTEKETSQSETDEDDNISVNDSGYSIVKSACVTTDDAIKDSCQNVVRFIKNGSRVMTAGEDGIIRVWSLPVLKPKEVMEGHQKEITNIVIHPNTELCVSLSRDCTCRVWDLESYSEIKCLKWTKYGEYRFRSCCFSDNGDYLFTINIPLKLSSKQRKKSYVCKWNTTDWQVLTRAWAEDYSNCLVCLSVTRDNYIAIGNISGDISVLTTDLKLLFKTKGVHTSFITGLCFISRNTACPPLLLSTSVDKKCHSTIIKKKDGAGHSVLFMFVMVAVLVIIVAMVIGMYYT